MWALDWNCLDRVILMIAIWIWENTYELCYFFMKNTMSYYFLLILIVWLNMFLHPKDILYVKLQVTDHDLLKLINIRWQSVRIWWNVVSLWQSDLIKNIMDKCSRFLSFRESWVKTLNCREMHSAPRSQKELHI